MTRGGISDDDLQRIVRLIEQDVIATVSADCRELIARTAARLRPLCNQDDYLDRVVGDVQQRLHDEFIDTTWPRCPLHPSHPLWLVDGSWTCTESGRAIASLGKLQSGV